MSFDLEVHVIGLCFFRPELPEEGGRMQVLLPKSHAGHAGHGGHGGHHVDPHFARLAYDPAYETPRAEELGLWPPRLVRLERNAVGIAGLGQPATAMPLPDRVLNLTQRLGTRVRPELLAGPVDFDQLTARVTLANATAEQTRDGAVWAFQGEEREFPLGATWTIPIPGDRLEWTVDGPALDFRPLFPIDGKVVVYVLNLPGDELPDSLPPIEPFPPKPEPAFDEPAHHYEAYYSLLENPPADRPLPRFRRRKPTKFAGAASCMTGGGQP